MGCRPGGLIHIQQVRSVCEGRRVRFLRLLGLMESDVEGTIQRESEISSIADHFARSGRHREVAGLVERLEEDMTDGEEAALGNDEVSERHTLGKGAEGTKVCSV